MDKTPDYKEPLSSALRRRAYGNEEQIAETVRWVAFSSLFVLMALIINQLLMGKYIETMVILIGMLPIIISLLLIKRGRLTLPIAIFTIGSILLLTYLSTVGNGVHDVAIMAFPADSDRYRADLTRQGASIPDRHYHSMLGVVGLWQHFRLLHTRRWSDQPTGRFSIC
ncbi:MAG: hypothetical protein V9E84_06535 [Trichococcus flocculiformis]